jgi:uncharacterized protein RhaS with RHS repeats
MRPHANRRTAIARGQIRPSALTPYIAERMASLTINGVLQAEYKYDFAGRQAVRRLPQLGVTLHSVFDAQGRRIAEYNEATGALVREYVWLGWSPVAVIEGGVVSFVRSDHIGRPVFATNAAGTKVWTASYLPFGGVRTTTGTPHRPLPRPVVPKRVRLAPELDARLRSDNRAVSAGRPAGVGGWGECVWLCERQSGEVD